MLKCEYALGGACWAPELDSCRRCAAIVGGGVEEATSLRGIDVVDLLGLDGGESWVIRFAEPRRPSWAMAGTTSGLPTRGESESWSNSSSASSTRGAIAAGSCMLKGEGESRASETVESLESTLLWLGRRAGMVSLVKPDSALSLRRWLGRWA